MAEQATDIGLERQGQDLVDIISGYEVVDQESLDYAAEHVRTIKVYLRRVAEVFDPIVEAAHRAHKVAVEQRNKLTTRAEGIEKALKKRMGDYEMRQKALAEAAEAAARQARERLEAEARATAAAEQARRQALAEAEALEAALAAEASGDTETAERILAEPIEAPVVAPVPIFTPPPAVQRARTDGVAFSVDWKVEVTSLQRLVEAISKGQAPLSLVKADESALKALARSTKGTLKVPGVEFTEDRTVRVGA